MNVKIFELFSELLLTISIAKRRRGWTNFDGQEEHMYKAISRTVEIQDLKKSHDMCIKCKCVKSQTA